MDNHDITLLCEREMFYSGKKGRIRWMLWFPFGIFMALYRIAILLIYSLLIQLFPASVKKRAYKVFLGLMNIHVTSNLSFNKVKEYTEGCVVASNHVSIFDHFPALSMPLATLMVDHTDSFAGKIVGFLLFKSSGSSYWQVGNLKQMMKSFRGWNKSPAGIALYVTPEATINNGRGLFLFRPDFLVRGRPVVPVALKISLPFNMVPNPLHAKGPAKFLRLLMSPVICFRMDYLSKIPAYLSAAESGSPQDYANRVQHAIAEHLAIPATQFTPQDKARYRSGSK